MRKSLSQRRHWKTLSSVPARLAAAIIASPSATDKHMIFSTTTCRPASSGGDGQRRVGIVRRGHHDQLDGRVGEQRGVGVVGSDA